MNGRLSVSSRWFRTLGSSFWLSTVLVLASATWCSATEPPQLLFADDLETGSFCYQWAAVLTPEICNGADDDCNYSIDEADPGGGEVCNTGLSGVCGPGVTQCSDASLVCVQNVQPSAEVCDGFDNDCNGTVDDVPGAGNVCTTGMPGVCSAGVILCSGSNLTCVQNVQPSAEVCDGLDNDCDGTVDEGCPL